MGNKKQKQTKGKVVMGSVEAEPAAPIKGAAKETLDVSLLAGTDGHPSFEQISDEAIAWAIECGLKMPLSARASAAHYGYSVEVSELAGKFRTSNLRYTLEGERQMYERARWSTRR